MSGGWWMVLCGAAVLGWTVWLDLCHHHDARLAGRWVPRARRQGRWAGPVAFASSLVLLVGFVLLGLIGAEVGSALGDRRWALVVVGPAMLAYVPFAVATMPAQSGGYRAWRRDLVAAGADRRLARTIAWWAGVPSLLGTAVAATALIVVFLP